MKWYVRMPLIFLPFLIASIVETHYGMPSSATWWLGFCIALSGIIGVYLERLS